MAGLAAVLKMPHDTEQEVEKDKAKETPFSMSSIAEEGQSKGQGEGGQSLALSPTRVSIAFQLAVSFVFIFLSVSIRICQHGVRDLHYNFLCPIVIITLVKIVMSLACYVACDGPLWEIPGKLCIAHAMIFRYSAVAALYCVYDVLSFVNLMNFGPTTYVVFLNLRTPLTGVVWERAFGKPLSWFQRGALLLIIGGCAMKQSGGNLNFTALNSSPATAFCLLMVQVVANVVAGVANEMLLKEKTDVPFNLQNLIQYTWVLLFCLLAAVVAPFDGIRLNLLDVSEWAKVLHPRMVPNIVLLSCVGLTTSVLLKYLDSVWKAICTSIELFVTAFVAAAVFGYSVGFVDFIALVLLGFGIYVYAAPWAKYTDQDRAM